MYGLCAYIYRKSWPNVGKYTIHWAFGNGLMDWLLRRRQELLFVHFCLTGDQWRILQAVGGSQVVEKKPPWFSKMVLVAPSIFCCPICKPTEPTYWYRVGMCIWISWSNSSVSLCVSVDMRWLCVISCLLRENMTANMDVNFRAFSPRLTLKNCLVEPWLKVSH